jgi:hypothetical protein
MVKQVTRGLKICTGKNHHPSQAVVGWVYQPREDGFLGWRARGFFAHHARALSGYGMS